MSPAVDAVEEAETEEDAIAAVRRLWKELGLLWPEDVEDTPVDDFNDQDLGSGWLSHRSVHLLSMLF